MKGQYSVTKRSNLLVHCQEMSRVGDPAGGEAHEPFNELRGRTWCCSHAQEGWCRGWSAGDVLPSGDGVGIASPAVKMLSISDHSVSEAVFLLGEPCGPLRARSMIWCDSAIVPLRACTCSSVSPPRVESVASGVRNSALAVGEDEDAEPGVGSSDEGCW